MKKVMCRELGETMCEHVFIAGSYEELMQQAYDHVMSDPGHAKDREDMKGATQMQKNEWTIRTHALWYGKGDE